MTQARKPASFRIEPEAPEPAKSPERAGRTVEPARKPRALKPPVVVPAEIDVFDEPDIVVAEPPPAAAPRRRSLLATIFLSAFGVLLSLAIGLWTDSLIRALFERAQWLGWLAAGVAGIAAYRRWTWARDYLLVGGLAYALLAAYGALVDHDADANFVPLNDADDWLHLGLAVAMIVLGLALTPRRRHDERRTTPAERR